MAKRRATKRELSEADAEAADELLEREFEKVIELDPPLNLLQDLEAADPDDRAKRIFPARRLAGLFSQSGSRPLTSRESYLLLALFEDATRILVHRTPDCSLVALAYFQNFPAFFRMAGRIKPGVPYQARRGLPRVELATAAASEARHAVELSCDVLMAESRLHGLDGRPIYNSGVLGMRLWRDSPRAFATAEAWPGGLSTKSFAALAPDERQTIRDGEAALAELLNVQRERWPEETRSLSASGGPGTPLPPPGFFLTPADEDQISGNRSLLNFPASAGDCFQIIEPYAGVLSRFERWWRFDPIWQSPSDLWRRWRVADASWTDFLLCAMRNSGLDFESLSRFAARPSNEALGAALASLRTLEAIGREGLHSPVRLADGDGYGHGDYGSGDAASEAMKLFEAGQISALSQIKAEVEGLKPPDLQKMKAALRERRASRSGAEASTAVPVSLPAAPPNQKRGVPPEYVVTLSRIATQVQLKKKPLREKIKSEWPDFPAPFEPGGDGKCAFYDWRLVRGFLVREFPSRDFPEVLPEKIDRA